MYVVGVSGEGTTPAALGLREAWSILAPGTQRAAVATAALAAAAAVGWWADTRWATVSAVSLIVLLAAAVVDLVEHRLPNGLVLAAAVPVAAAVAVAAAAGSDAWTGSFAGASVVGLPLLGTHLAAPAGLGFGDVKAGVVLGGGVGLVSPALAVAGLMLGLVGTATWAVAGRHRAVPLGPGMVIGTVAALAAGRLLGVRPW